MKNGKSMVDKKVTSKEWARSTNNEKEKESQPWNTLSDEFFQSWMSLFNQKLYFVF